MVNPTAVEAAAIDEAALPTPRVAWTTVFILFVFYVFAMVARQVMSILVDPIKHELHITDIQASLLLGLSFAIFFTTIGLAMGWLGDRVSRRVLIAISVGLWGLASAACGLAHTFGELFLARMLVGVGEAALGPAAFSLLSDSFRPKRLGLALSLYSAGGLVGGAIAILGGGLIVKFSAAHGLVNLPILGEVSSWRAVFLLTGLPGPLLALAMFLVPEPKRTGRLIHGANPTDATLGSFLKRNWVLMVWLCLGYGALNMIVNNVFAWTPTVMKRSLGLGPVQVGLLITGLLMFCAVPGQIVNGAWIDREASKGRGDGYLRYYVMFLPFAALCGVAGLLSATPVWFMAGLVPLFFVSNPFMGSASTALQRFTPNEYRGRVSAIFLMVTMLIGLGIGPTLVAVVSTSIDPKGNALGTALAMVVGGAAVLAVVCLAAGRSAFRRALAERETGVAVPHLG